MELANRKTFPEPRPQAELTTARPELLVGGSDEAFRQMVHDALAFASRLQAVRDGYAGLIGLTGVQYTVLIAIHHLQYERDVSVAALARHLHLSAPFVTTETNKLVAMVLVEKFRDPDDGRRLVLRTTSAAQSRLDRLAGLQRPVNDEHFAPLVQGGLETFARLTSELVDSTDRALALLSALHSGAGLIAGDALGSAIPVEQSAALQENTVTPISRSRP